MNTRDQQKEKRREEILLAGLDLFVKKGYAATKTSDIAKAVNMSDGLLFHYFATKESLYEELIRIGTESSQAWMETDERSPLNFFTNVTNQILDMIRVNPQGAEFFVLIAQALRSSTTPERITQIMASQETRYAKTVELIRKGQEAGEIRRGNPEALVQHPGNRGTACCISADSVSAGGMDRQHIKRDGGDRVVWKIQR